jgi:hypothetical protein
MPNSTCICDVRPSKVKHHFKIVYFYYSVPTQLFTLDMISEALCFHNEYIEGAYNMFGITMNLFTTRNMFLLSVQCVA